MSYFVRTRYANLQAKRRNLGALDPSFEVPGTGHTVAELRASGWTDEQIAQLISDQPQLAIELYNANTATAPRPKSGGSVSDWLNKESFPNSGIKNGHLALGGALLLTLAAVGGGRKR